jgi:glycopeptide antibiotics resistance protein
VPNRRDLTDWSDILLNVLGFVPFGALVVVYVWVATSSVSKKDVFFAVLAGLSISMAIELLQVFLPSRDSSLLDVIMNTLGTWIGASAAVTACSRLCERKAGPRRHVPET